MLKKICCSFAQCYICLVLIMCRCPCAVYNYQYDTKILMMTFLVCPRMRSEKSPENVTENARNLKALTQRVFDAIVASAERYVRVHSRDDV